MFERFLYQKFGFGQRVKDVPTLAACYAVLTKLLEDCEAVENDGTVDSDYRLTYYRSIQQIESIANIEVAIPNLWSRQNISHADFLFYLRNAVLYLRKIFASELDFEQAAYIVEHLQDATLRQRCIDLLLSHAHYDRAVSEATKLLEDRLRSIHGKADLSGLRLVEALLPENQEQATLNFGDQKGLYSGYRSIIRGIFQAHRNVSHHTIYDVSRIDAARICAYIDLLLGVIEKAAGNKRNEPVD